MKANAPERVWLPLSVVQLAAVSPELKEVEGDYFVRASQLDAAVREAIRLIHSDEPEGNYQAGMEILCKLAGYSYPSAEAMRNAKSVTIQEVAARDAATDEQGRADQ